MGRPFSSSESTPRVIFRMVDAAGLAQTGLDVNNFTLYLGKDTAVLAALGSATVVEGNRGWYMATLTNTEVNVDGLWIFEAEHSTLGANEIWADMYHVVTRLDDAGIRAAIGLASANLDTQLSNIPTNVEAALINEGDGQQLIDAILQVINSNLDLPALELAAIATQVRTELAVELARIDVAISSVSGGGGSGDNPPIGVPYSFSVYMQDESGNAAPGLALVVQRSIDDGPFEVIEGTVDEVGIGVGNGNGFYHVNATGNDMNGQIIDWYVTAPGHRARASATYTTP